MRVNPHRASLAAAIVAALLLTTGCSVFYHPQDNYYVGQTREQIIDQLGPPTNRWPGHYGAPEAGWASQFDPVETLTFEKWGGTLYVSVSPKDGRWVCFCSNWLPKGGVF